MNRLPSDWTSDRLKDVATINASALSAETDLDYEFDYLEISNVDYHGIVDPEAIERVRYEDAPSRARRRVAKNSTVISSVRPNLQAIAFLPERRDHLVCSTGFNVVQPDEARLSPHFAYFALISEGARQYFEATAKGVGYPAVDDKDFTTFSVPLPPLPEQERIAAYLDASCAEIDAAVAAKRRQLETFDKMHKATLQRAVTRGLSERPRLKATDSVWMKEIPEDWQLLALKRISEIQTGLTLGKTYDGPLIERPYLRVANVQDGHLDLNDITTIEVPPDVARRVELRIGDVLMTEGGDLDKLGRGYIWDGQIADCLHQNHIFAVRCFPYKLLQKFLAYLTVSQYGRDYFEATGKRTTNLASTNSTKVGAFPIPLPSLHEQARIIEFLDDRTKQHRDIQANIDGQIAILTAYRKSLIHECVTGQRRVTEADVRRVEAQKEAAISWTPRHEETSANETSQ